MGGHVTESGDAGEGGLQEGPFRASQTWINWATGMLVLAGVVSVFAIDYITYDLHTLYDLQAGSPVALERSRAHTRLQDMSTAFIVVFVLAAIVWLVWQYRAHVNLRALGAQGLAFPPAGAVGSWFVPVGNLVLPYLAMRELWRAADPEAGPSDWKRVRTTPLLPLWWVGWWSGVALGAIGAGKAHGGGAATAHELISRDWYFAAACGVFIATAVAAIAVIRQINGRLFVRGNKLGRSWTGWSQGWSRS
jgi:Domain of unknown function (DUF4328)